MIIWIYVKQKKSRSGFPEEGDITPGAFLDGQGVKKVLYKVSLTQNNSNG